MTVHVKDSFLKCYQMLVLKDVDSSYEQRTREISFLQSFCNFRYQLSDFSP